MANRYWVGGTGTWTTTTTNWSASSGGAGGASVPTAADAVFFDQAGTYTVTIAAGARTCLDITVSAGTVTFASTGTLTVSGSMYIKAGTVWSATGLITFGGTGAKTITTNGTILTPSITLSGASSTWTLGSDLTLGPTATCTFSATSGVLALNDFTLTTGIFSSSSTVVRRIEFGSGNIVLAHTTAAQIVLAMATTTGFTWTGTGGFVAAANITRTFQFASNGADYAPNLTFTGSGTAVQTLTTGSWFKQLDFGTTAFNPGTTSLNVTTLILSTGGTYSALSVIMRYTGTITSNGKAIAALNISSTNTTLTGALSCTTYTQASGTFDLATFNLTCSSSASFAGVTSALANIGVITCTTWTTSSGTFNLDSGTITPSVSFVVSGSGTFNYTGGTLSAVPTFTHTAGTVSFGKAYTLTATGTYTLTAGTLELNGNDLTTGIFSSSGTGVRSIAFGTGNIVLSHTTAAQTVLNMATATNFSWTGTGGFISNAAITRTFSFGTTGGTSTNAPNLSITSGSAITTIVSNSRFNILDFTGNSSTPAAGVLYVNALILSASGTYTNIIPVLTATQTWTSQYSKVLGGIGVGAIDGTLTLDDTQTYTATSIFYLVAGTLDLGGYDLTIGTFSSINTDTRAIAFGANNIVLATTTAAQVNLSMANATGFTWSGTGGFIAEANITRTFTFGTTGGSSTNAPDLTFTGGGTAVQTLTTASWFNNLDFGTTAFNPGTTTINSGNLTLSNSGTFTGLTAVMVTNGNITTNGKTIAALQINAPLSVVTLDGPVTYASATASTTLTAGTLDLNGNDLTTGIFSSSGTGVRSIAFGTNNITLATTAAAATVLNMATATNFSWTGTGGFVSTMSVTRTFEFGTTGGSNTIAPNLTLLSGASIGTISTGSWFNNLDFGTTAFTIPVTIINVNNIVLSSSGTYTSLTIVSAGEGSITTNNKPIGGFTVNSSANTKLNDSFTTTATGITTLSSGTLDLNNFTLTTGSFSSSGIGVRAIAFGSSNIVLSHTTAATTVLSMADVTNFTCTGTGGFISNAAITRTFTFGTTSGTPNNAPNLAITSGSAVTTFTNGSWFNVLDFTGSANTPAMNSVTIGIYVDTLTLATGGTYTGLIPVFTRTQTWTSQFSKQLGGIGVGSEGVTLTLDDTQTYTATSSCILTAGILDLGGFDQTFGLINSTAAGVRAIAFGSNNIILAHTTAATVVLSMANATTFSFTGTGGFISDAAITRTFSFGTTGGTIDNAPNLTFTTGTAVQTLSSNSWFNKLDFGTTAFNPGVPTLNLNSLVLSSAAGVYTGLNVKMLGTGTIASNSKTLASLVIDNVSGTTTLLDDFSLVATGVTTMISGGLDLNGFTLTTGVFSSSNSNVRTINFGTSNIVLVHTTAATGVLTMATATNFSCTGTGGFSATANITRTFTVSTSAGSSPTSPPNLFITSGAAVPTFTTNSWFNVLDFTGSTCTPAATTVRASSLVLATGGTYTSMAVIMLSPGTLNGNSKSISALTINHDGITLLDSPVTVVGATTFGATLSPTLDLNGYDLTTGTFASSYTTARSVIFGSNYIYLSGTGTVLAMAIADNFTHTGIGSFRSINTGSQVFAFGSTSGADESNAAKLWLSAGAGGFGFATNSWFNTLDFTGSTATSATATIKVNNLILGSGGTYLALTANMYGASSTINGSGRSLLTFTIPASSTATLSSALGVVTYTQAAETTLDLAGFTLTASASGGVAYNGGALIFNAGVISTTTFALNGPTFVLDDGTINCSTSFVINSGSFTLGVNGFLGATPLFTHTSGEVTFEKDYSQTVIGTYTLTSGTLYLNNHTLTTGIFNSSNTNMRSIAFGTGSIALTHTTASTLVLSMADATGFSYTGTGGFTSNMNVVRLFRFGSASGGSISTAPNLSITGGASEVLTITGSWFNKLDFTGSTSGVSGVTAATATTLNLQSLILGNGTYTRITANILDAGTINGNNKSISALNINHISNTTFTDSLSVAGIYTQTSGDVDFGGYNLSVTGATSYISGTLANIGTITCTTWTVDGNFILTNGTITPSTSFVLNSGSFTYTGGILSPVPLFRHTSGTVTFSKSYELTATGTYTHTAGDLILDGYNVTTGIYSSSNSNTRSIAFGINDVILSHPTAATIVLDIAVATNFTNTATTGGFRATANVARTFRFGSSGGGSLTNAPNLTFTTGSAVQTLSTTSWFNKLDFGTTTFTAAAATVNLNSLILSAGGTYTVLSPTMVGTGIINTSGKTIANFSVNTPEIATLGSNITCTTYAHVTGSIDYAGYTINSSGATTITNGTLTGIDLSCGSFIATTGTTTLESGTINTTSFTVTSSGTFNYIGGNLSSVTNFTHTSGVVNVINNLIIAPTSTYTFTLGTLTINNNVTLTIGIFSSSNANVRSILFGTGNIALVHPTLATTVLSLANATNFNYTGTGGFTADASVTRTFVFGTTGGVFNNAPNLSITSGDQIPTFTNNSWFKVLDFTGNSSTPAASTVNVDTLILSADGTYTSLIPQFTRTQTWTTQFGKVLGGIGVNRLFTTLTLGDNQPFTSTSTCSLVTGTLNLGGFDLIIGSFISSSLEPRAVIFGDNNIVLNHSTAGQTVLSVVNSTNFSYTTISGGFVSDASVTRTYVFGTTGGNAATAPNLLISSGTAIPTITTGSWFNKLNFTGSSCTPATTLVNVSSLTLSSGGTFTGLSATMRSNGTITPNGKSIAALVINHTDFGTTTLEGALVCTTQSYIIGNVDFANFNLTGTTATYNSGSFSNINVLACTIFTIAGNFQLVTGTLTPSTSIVISSGSLTYEGGTISPVSTFTHTAGTVTLRKDYALTLTGTYTLTAGSLNLNNNNLTTGIFSSTGTGTRSIAFGTGNVILAHTTAATVVLSMAIATNFNHSGTGGFVSDASLTRTYTFGTTGGNATNAPNLAINSGAAIPTITTNSWFNQLDFTGSSCTPAAATVRVSTLTLATDGTYTNLIPNFTRTQTWTSQFSKVLGGIGVDMVGGTLTLDGTQTYTALGASTCFLVNGTLDLGGSDLTIGAFSSNNSNVRLLNFGNNNIILTTTSGAIIMGTMTNFAWTGTGGFVTDASATRTFTVGASAGGSSTNAPNLTFTGSGTFAQTLTTGSWFNKLDFGTTAFAVPTTDIKLNSLALSPNGTYTAFRPVMVSSGTISGNDSPLMDLTINHNGTTTLVSNVSVTGNGTSPTTLTSGTLDLNGFTLTTTVFSSSGANIRSIAFGNSNIVLGTTLIPLAMANATNFTWTGTGGFVAVADYVNTQYQFGSTAGGSATNAPNLTFTGSGTATQRYEVNSWFNRLDFGTTTCTVTGGIVNVSTLILSSGGTFTGLIPLFTRTQTWTEQFSKQLGGIGVADKGATLTLDGTQTYPATASFNLFAGTLDLGGYDLTIGAFSSSNTNNRAIAFGTNNIVLATTTAAQVNLSMAIATNFSYTGTGGFTAAADITRTFTFGTTGGSSTNAPDLTFTGSGTAVQTITTNSCFRTLNFGTTTCTINGTILNLNSVLLSAGGTNNYVGLNLIMFGSGTITPNGKDIPSLTINHTGTTTLAGALSITIAAGNAATTLTSGTLNLNNFTLTTGIFSSSNANTRSIQFGSGNISLRPYNNSVTVLSIANATNFSCTGTGGFVARLVDRPIIQFGNTNGGSSANAPNLAFSGTSSTSSDVPTFANNSWFNTLDFTQSLMLGQIPTTTVNVNSILLQSAGVTTYTGLTVNMVGNGTITSNGKTIAALNVDSDNLSLLETIPYKVYTFASTGSITFSESEAPPTLEYLVVGGGGAGGGGHGGGGGAGGLLTGSLVTIPDTPIAITVGAGGSGVEAGFLGLSAGSDGSNSAIGSYVETAGGGGGATGNGTAGGYPGNSGGSGGGGSLYSSIPGTGIVGQGNDGGEQGNYTPITSVRAGGGGGAGGAGTTGKLSATDPGLGGIGTLSHITGIATYYSGGGGGASWSQSVAGIAAGGAGGGGTGNRQDSILAQSGTDNTGGGGGGGSANGVSGSGGSGIVIIRYLASYADPLSTTGSPIVSTIIDVPIVPTPSSTNDIVTLNDALTVTGTTTLTLGKLDLNNFTLTTFAVSSNNSNFRAINFGSANIGLTMASAGTALNMADATNFTWTGTGGFTTAMTTNKLFAFGNTAGGNASNAPNLALTSGAGIIILETGSWFKVLDFTGSTGTQNAFGVNVDTLTLATGGTYTGLIPVFTRTQTWTSQFSKQLGGIGVNGAGVIVTLDDTQTYTATSECILTAGILDLGGYDLTIGTFKSNNTNVRAIAFGSNNIILSTTLVDVLNLDILNATGFTWTGTGGFAASANIARKYAVGASLPPTGASNYTTPGTYIWVAPEGVTSVSVVAIGGGGSGGTSYPGLGKGGGGGGGGLGWKNNIEVVPGQSYTVVVGSGGSSVTASRTSGNTGTISYFINSTVVAGLPGQRGVNLGGGNAIGGPGGNRVGDGGGNGGTGGGTGGGGGGAGGYAGSGGGAGLGGAGGGGGGGRTGDPGTNGGGVGIFGQGASGIAGTTTAGGGGGSGGGAGVTGTGGAFGGGSGGRTLGPTGSGGGGAVRIIWGPYRSYPSALTAAAYDVSGSGEGAAAAENAPNLTFNGSGTAVQTFISGSWFNNLDFGTTAFAVPSSILTVNTLTLSSAGTYVNLVPVFTRTQTWTPQHNKQLGGIGVNGAGVTVTLDDTQTYNTFTGKLIVNSGTINLAGNSIDFYDFESTEPGSRSITGAGSLNIYNNWNVFFGAGFDSSGCTINMISGNFYKIFAGGGGVYGTLVQKSAAPLTITGSNSFENIQVSNDMSPVTPPAGIDFLMVAGGGGHQIGGDANAGLGGSGAGGLIYRTGYIIPDAVLTEGKTITVTVGAGGAAANGNNSSIKTADNTVLFTTLGGGRGGLFQQNGIAGGSGGGGGGRNYPPGDGGAAQQPSSASGGVGFAGGRCRTLDDGSGTAAGGGGGGAGAVGVNGVSQQGGAGGAGLVVPIINSDHAATHGIGQVISTNVWFAGGGGGEANGTGGAGGAGGGAPGASSVYRGSGVIGNTQSNATGVRNGKSNTGGGSGGASTGFSGYGGTGGSGVVVIRHPRISGYEAATTGNCIIEYEDTDILYIFKSSGTITF